MNPAWRFSSSAESTLKSPELVFAACLFTIFLGMSIELCAKLRRKVHEQEEKVFDVVVQCPQHSRFFYMRSK